MAVALTLRRTLLIAAAVGFVDALVLNQGFVALVALGALIGGVSRALAALIRHDWPTMRLRFARTGIYLAMAVVVIAANLANAQMAQRRADALIAACRQYEARHGRLPDRLEDLVPEFITSVPHAKYTLTLNWFWYRADGGRHTLMWFVGMPVSRYYIFEENRWDSTEGLPPAFWPPGVTPPPKSPPPKPSELPRVAGDPPYTARYYGGPGRRSLR